MLNRSNLHSYQEHSVQHILDNPRCALFLEMGLGKTVSTLTAIDELMFDRMEIQKALVIAPKRVARDTWPDEIKEWAHVRHLTVSAVIGSAAKRVAALKTPANIYTINRENVEWLVGVYGSKCPFDMIVIDELSSFKSSKAVRFKSLKQWSGQCTRVVGLTGTPSPNGYEDLWAEIYLLDQGKRLGQYVTHFRDRFFTIDPKTAYSTYPKRILRDGAREKIHELIGDICLSMKARDYLDLPPVQENLIRVHLSESEMKAYEDFERHSIMELPEGDIPALSATALRNKLIQFASGAVYKENKKEGYVVVSDAKMEALDEILEFNDEPIIIYYWYQHTFERLKERFKKYKPRTLETKKDQDEWNAGKIRLLLAQPASMGHGINIQKGGRFEVWYGFPESLEVYLQACMRLERQGQTAEFTIRNKLVAVGTLEETLIESLNNKGEDQDLLMRAVDALKRKYKKA